MKQLMIVLISSIVILTGCGGGGSDSINGPPSIEYTKVPPFGSWGIMLEGRVRNVVPAQVKTITFIKVAERWWVKPYYTLPFIQVEPNRTFKVQITTGGIDEAATEIRTWLVTQDYNESEQMPPDPPTPQVLARCQVTRSP